MSNERVQVVLVKSKKIRDTVRNPGYILMEGVCSANVLSSDVDKAILLNQARVKVVRSESKKEKKQGASKSKD